jgi:hypothetical protein
MQTTRGRANNIECEGLPLRPSWPPSCSRSSAVQSSPRSTSPRVAHRKSSTSSSKARTVVSGGGGQAPDTRAQERKQKGRRERTRKETPLFFFFSFWGWCGYLLLRPFRFSSPPPFPSTHPPTLTDHHSPAAIPCKSACVSASRPNGSLRSGGLGRCAARAATCRMYVYGCKQRHERPDCLALLCPPRRGD